MAHSRQPELWGDVKKLIIKSAPPAYVKFQIDGAARLNSLTECNIHYSLDITYQTPLILYTVSICIEI